MRTGRLWALAGAGILALILGVTWLGTGRAGPQPLEREALRFVDVVRRPGTDDVLESLVAQERYADAIARSITLLRRDLQTSGALHPATLAGLRRVATVFHLSGDQRVAGEVLDALLPVLRKLPAPDPSAQCETLIRRGYVARYQGDRARAQALYDEASALLNETMADRAPLEAFLLQARADWMRGPDRERAVSLYLTALRSREHCREVSWFTLADNEAWTAFTLARAGRWSAARQHIAASRKILHAIGIRDHSLLGTLDQLEGEDRVVHGRWDEAAALSSAAAAQAKRTRERTLPGLSRGIAGSQALEILAADALARRSGEEAWELRERGLAGVHADFAMLGDWSRREPATYGEARELSLRLLEATRQWEVAGRTWSPAAADLLLRRLQAQADLGALRAAYLADHPPPSPDLSEMQSLLDAETAMIGWLEVHVGDHPSGYTQPRESMGAAFVLRKDRPLQWVHLYETRDEAQWRAFSDFYVGIHRLVRAATWPERVLPDAPMLADLKERGRRFFDPLRPSLQGVRRLVVVGNLALLPEVFVGPDGRYLEEDFEIVHVPSAATFAVLSASEARARVDAPPRSILAVAAGDPAGELPRLPFLKGEVASISKSFVRAVRMNAGADLHARLEALARRGELAGYDVVHLAGHAVDDPAPERAAIALDGNDRFPGVLTVEDVVLSWRLNARLVTFSACQSSGNRGEQGEPLGFTAATLAAGGTNVLSSRWPVDDRASVLLMTRFYENLTGAGGEPMRASRALFEAKRYLRALTDPDGSRPFEHPAYWAAWAVLGTGE